MSRRKHFYFFIGTTAELIKMAPVIRQFNRKRVKYKLIYSGQVNIDFEEFDDYAGKIRPDIKLKPKGIDSSVIMFILWVGRTFVSSLWRLRKEFKNSNKSKKYMIVHGDTVSSLIGALVGRIYMLKVVHIEAGLRSFNFLEPFPEEISRYIISELAIVHFCPNEWSCNNLKDKQGKIVNTKHNTLIEFFNYSMKKINRKNKKIKEKYFVLVVHRQEHVIFGKKQTKYLLKNIFKHLDEDLYCVFLVHDISVDFVESIGFDKEKIILQKRHSYIDFMELIYHAEFMITDGGSNQEELSYMGKPTLILRNVTERIEGLDDNIVLSKYDSKKIKQFISNYDKYKSNRTGTIHARPSEKIFNNLTKN